MTGDWLKKPSGGSSAVFVHGFLSSGEAWRHANGEYWPQLLADAPELPSLGVYVFQYQTTFFDGRYNLSDVVDALKEHMRLDGVTNSSRLVFVCHSMGGIAVRKYLTERVTELLDRGTEVGLFLVASPSVGSSYATWLKPLAVLLGHSQADALRFQESNTWLNTLDKDFKNLKEAGRLNVTGKELIEAQFPYLPQWWRKQIVEPFSGARYFGEPFKVPESDHFSIAKPDGAKAIQHRLLVRFIQDMMRASPEPEQAGEARSNKAMMDRVSTLAPETPAEPDRHLSRGSRHARTGEYDRWYNDLENGFVEIAIDPADIVEVTALNHTVSDVLQQKAFSHTVIGNVRVVLLELLTNVARHATGSKASVQIWLKDTRLTTIELTVSDQGRGYALWDVVKDQYFQLARGEREHGLGRICRLSDVAISTDPDETNSSFAIRCAFYDLPWPGSIGDPYHWCETILLDYTAAPASVWFGRRRHALWWIDEREGFLGGWAALGALNFAIDHGVREIFDLYLGALKIERCPYLLFEIRGHGGTETGVPRGSAETIAQTLEAVFRDTFSSKTVVLYASRNAYTGVLERLSAQYDVPMFVSEAKCGQQLRAIDGRLSP